MKKLEIKHLAPYLPYGLKLKCYTDGYPEEIYTMKTLSQDVIVGTGENRLDVEHYHFEDIKPILRPLSDLTRKIEHNGKEFVPTVFFYQPLNVSPSEKSYIVDELKFLASVNHFPEDTVLFHFVVQKLFEWHFDVFNLIRDGLSVNINKLKQDK